MERTKVFISYSHEDEGWRKRLAKQLSVLAYQGLLHVWDDAMIDAGDAWYQNITDAITDSRVAILIVTANFLTSKFVLSEEIPQLLGRHSESGLRILPLITTPCAWKLVNWLAVLQVRPKNGTPLSIGSDNQVDSDLTEFAYEVANLISCGPQRPEVHDELDKSSHSSPSTKEMVSLLIHAIEHGAPVYDQGSPIGCARIYVHAARNFIELARQPVWSERRIGAEIVQAARQALGAIVDCSPEITQENADRLAWDLRYTFNWIINILLKRKGLP
jgi:hypothetical protein